MLWHLPYNAVNKHIYKETQALTLSLYRSLLRTAHRFEQPHQQWFLNSMIRERFRFHQCETSRKRSLALLSDGDKALQQMTLALDGNVAVQKYIDDLSTAKIGPLAHAIKKLRKIPDLLQRTVTAVDIRSQASKKRHQARTDRVILPPHLLDLARVPTTIPSSRRQYNAAKILLTMQQRYQKKPRSIKWKPHQVIMVTQASSGFRFIRRRGIRQPVTTSMMMKNRARTNQKRVDKHYALTGLVDDIKSEGLFLSQLGVQDDSQEYLRPIHDALKQASRLVRPPSNIEPL
ncbi:hypothetical protein BC941DRAFT_424105, partial [Chlamydoabsidia padenii]